MSSLILLLTNFLRLELSFWIKWSLRQIGEEILTEAFAKGGNSDEQYLSIELHFSTFYNTVCYANVELSKIMIL